MPCKNCQAKIVLQSCPVTIALCVYLPYSAALLRKAEIGQPRAYYENASDRF